MVKKGRQEHHRDLHSIFFGEFLNLRFLSKKKDICFQEIHIFLYYLIGSIHVAIAHMIEIILRKSSISLGNMNLWLLEMNRKDDRDVLIILPSKICFI